MILSNKIILKSIFLFLMMTIASLLFSQKNIIKEEFINNSNNWEISNSQHEKSEVIKGVYLLSNYDSNVWHWFSSKQKLNYSQNWLIESNISIVEISKNNEFGIIWGANDTNQFQFLLNNFIDTSYAGAYVCENYNTHYTLIEPFVLPKLNINKKVKFTILHTLNNFYFLINDNPIGHCKSSIINPLICGNKIGFYVGTKNKISVENIVVKELLNNDLYLDTIKNKFPQFEEKIFYYNKEGFTYFDNQVITKENSETYRIFTIDDNNEIIGNIKEYTTLDNRLVAKFEAKKISSYSKLMDILTGEQITYNIEGNINWIATYYNEQNEISMKFSNHINGDICFFDSKGRKNKYVEMREGLENLLIEYDENGKIIFASKKCDQFVYKINAFGYYDKVYHESFKDSSIFVWPVGQISNSYSKFSGNKYLIKCNSSSGSFRFNKHEVNYNNDFSISIDITNSTKTQNAFSGILFGVDDNFLSGYSFLVSNFGSYAIGHQYNGIFITDLAWKNIDYPIEGYSLDVVKIGKLITFSVNGKVVKTLEYFPLVKNNIVLMTHGVGQESYFDNLIIKEINSELPKEFVKTDDIKRINDFKSSGTGFFVTTSGYIVTNYHVVKDAREIYVDIISNGKSSTLKALIIKTDKENDLALIKIQLPNNINFNAIPYCINSKSIEVGSSVFTLGYPYALSYLGKEIKFSDGKISSKSGYNNNINHYQVTVPVQPGNSGGPMFDLHGNVVGVINSKFEIGDNVSYAIKSSLLFQFLNSSGVVKTTNINNSQTKSYVRLTNEFEKFVVLIKVK